MRTVNQLIKDLQKIQAKGYGESILIYSENEFEDVFHKVENEPSLCRILINGQYSLDIVGFEGEVKDKDLNAVCIN